MPISELLMPAGSLDKLKVAILYGADAVYMGTPDLSLRTRSTMSLEDVVEGVAYAHAHGKRAYLTLNLFSHNRDIEKLPFFIDTIRKAKPDGVIIADPGVFAYVREAAPELELHISTQANVCSWLSVQFWEKQGASLVVLAREVSYAELREVREKCPDVRLEAFVHGAMCMTYSGRCLLSNYLAERGANQGNCANSCRWHYKLHLKLKDGSLQEIELNEHNKDLFEFLLEEEQRPGELLPIEENERGSYILNAKDLCLLPKLPDYLSIGIDSLKVEGRNRSAYYIAVTARAYRQAIDDWRRAPEAWRPDPYMKELHTIPTRGYSLAFHEGKLSHHAHNYEDTHTLSPWEYAGMIIRVTDEAFYVDIKNRIEYGDVLEFIPHNDRASMFLRIYTFEDVHHRRTVTEEGINAGQRPLLRIPFEWFHEEEPARLAKDFPCFTILRKERALTPEEWKRLELDRIGAARELGLDQERTYLESRDALAQAIDEGREGRVFRSPRLGAEGCCGRGCNGCLHFWHDPKYEKARAKLTAKKMGELLSSDERKTDI
ncbi:MAG: peptidase U32 [Proteobacteria bacterium]|jgi:putative protease|nr:U32 family peptidase [Alphaproteobacteria bacterium]NCC03814.1 peptidase U32 [Pseudomonadota bacterium]